MTTSVLGSKERRRFRREVEAAVRELPSGYLLEVVAKRLKVTNGQLLLRLEGGYLKDVARTRRLEVDELQQVVVRPYTGSVLGFLEEFAAAFGVRDGTLKINATDGKVDSIYASDLLRASALLDRMPVWEGRA